MRALEAFDLGLLYWITDEKRHRPWLDSLMKAVTHLGDTAVLLPASVLIVLLLLYWRQRRLAVLMVVIGLLSLFLRWSMKVAVNRPRPTHVTHLIELPHEPSFPSGHALCSMAIYLGAAILLARLVRTRGQAVLLITLAVLVSLAVGVSRSYVGVHYPLDVIGGWLAGLACAFIGAGIQTGGDADVSRRAAPVPTGTPLPRPAEGTSSAPPAASP